MYRLQLGKLWCALGHLSVEDNDRLLTVMSAVFGDTAKEELLDTGLVVLGHNNSRSMQIFSSLTDYFAYGVLVRVEVSNLNLIWYARGFHLAHEPPLYEGLCFADLLHIAVGYNHAQTSTMTLSVISGYMCHSCSVIEQHQVWHPIYLCRGCCNRTNLKLISAVYVCHAMMHRGA